MGRYMYQILSAGAGQAFLLSYRMLSSSLLTSYFPRTWASACAEEENKVVWGKKREQD